MANVIATHGSTSQSAGVNNFASGSFSTDAGATAVAQSITTGFKPRYVKVVDQTNATIYERLEGMAAANTVKTLPGTTGANDTVTQSIDAGTLIAFTDRGFTVAAGIAVASSSFAWVAWG